MLAELMRMKYGIAVAGAHGKTTTTSMIATVLAKGGLDPTAVIGGILDSLGGNAKLGQGEYLVAEADESDGTFLKLSPIITVVTNIDREHLDYYGDLEAIKDTFLEFINKIPFYGLAVLCLDDPYIPSLLARVEKRQLTYGLSPQAELQARGIKHHEDTSEFQIFHHKRRLGTVKLPLPGIHNVLNALAAVGVGLELEIPFDSIRDALSDFSGAHRRFQVKAHIDDIMVIDDYAHHPSEIRTTLGAAKEGWGKRLLVVFQPHRFTRTYHLWKDFVSVFEDADTLIVMDIYPAGEDPIEGVDAEGLSKDIRLSGHTGATHISDRHEVVERVMRDLLPGDMVLTLGAGDVWKISEDIVDRLERGDWPEHPEDE
jgi:UDP-N-acetylmuramate--alanine ligase